MDEQSIGRFLQFLMVIGLVSIVSYYLGSTSGFKRGLKEGADLGQTLHKEWAEKFKNYAIRLFAKHRVDKATIELLEEFDSEIAN